MPKKITVDGREISVKEEDFDYFVGLFEGQGYQVDYLPKDNITHEQYDFETFLTKALEYSDKSPPDITQFSEKVWGGAALCVREYYLKNFGVLIKSHAAHTNAIDFICLGFSEMQEALDVKNIWTRAEKSHSNFYGMSSYVAEGDRHALVDDIRKMAGLIEQSDKKL